jgi:hypothetical protein
VGKAYAKIATALGNNGKEKSSMNKLETIKEEAK